MLGSVPGNIYLVLYLKFPKKCLVLHLEMSGNIQTCTYTCPTNKSIPFHENIAPNNNKLISFLGSPPPPPAYCHRLVAWEQGYKQSIMHTVCFLSHRPYESWYLAQRRGPPLTQSGRNKTSFSATSLTLNMVLFNTRLVNSGKQDNHLGSKQQCVCWQTGWLLLYEKIGLIVLDENFWKVGEEGSIPLSKWRHSM